MTRRIALLAAVILVAGGLAWLGTRSQETSPDDRSGSNRRVAVDPAVYVGRQACAGCHEKQARLWQGSHHDLAMQVAGEATVLGDFEDATFTLNGSTSTFFRRDGKFLVRTDGPDGELHDYEIAYTFGVDPLQQYLIELPGGRYQALGVCWDTRPAAAGGQRWFHLYPDEPIPHDDPLHWTAPSQNWNFMCAECHSTNLEKGYVAAENRYETTFAEIDVACEACHGPGSRHLAWARGETRGETVADPDRVAPDRGLAVRLADTVSAAWEMDGSTGIAKRSTPRRSRLEVETCGRCHARRSVVDDRYVHGRPLMDTHRPALLDADLYHSDGQIAEEVYVYGSFLQSRMFAQGVTCKDCHEPHSLRLYGSADTVCARCHLPEKFATPAHHFHPQESAGASCVACHMAAETYMGVDPRRDHSFRVPRPDLTLKIGTPNACGDCHGDRPAAWAARAVAGWYGAGRAATPHWGEALDAGRRGLPGSDTALASVVDDPEVPAIARATALTLLSGIRDRRTADVVATALGDRDPLVRAAALRAAETVAPEQRLRLAQPLLTDPVRTVRLEAARVLAPVAQRITAEQRFELDAALAEYVDSQRVNADRPDAHLNLGLIHSALGDLEAAERSYLRALEIDPTFAPTYVNLADLYRATGRDEEGERTLRRGIERVAALSPAADADLHHALGLLLVRQKRRAEALPALARAADLAPAEARYGYVLAVALWDAGQAEGALQRLAAVHRRHPGDRQVVSALATFHRQQGSLAPAVDYARKLVRLAPEDPQARRLLSELEAAAGR